MNRVTRFKAFDCMKPIEPKEGTDKADVLAVLRAVAKRNEPFWINSTVKTEPAFVPMWHIMRHVSPTADRRLHELRRDNGFNIVTKMLTYKSGKKTRTIGTYRLEEK